MPMTSVEVKTEIYRKSYPSIYDDAIAHRIAKLYKQAPLTDFSSVHPHTDLHTLNLNWREKDLPECIRTKHVHRLHPYMGKFIPQLVEIFLRKFEPKLVYDPFCGSGTTLVEANTLGINSIGADISAFNALLSRVKTYKYDIKIVEKDLCDILKKVSDYIKKSAKETKLTKKFTTSNEYLNVWFAEQARKELLCYLSLIPYYRCRGLLKIILSRSARSARLVTHYDLDFSKKPQQGSYYCYKHRRTCYPVQEAYKFLERYTMDTIERVREFVNIRTNAEVKVIHGDSREIDLPKNIDMVFTSPPYIGLIDYHEQHKYAYELLGLENNETREIGAAKNGQSDEAKTKYINGINEVLLNTREFMTKNGLAIIVVNDKYNLYDSTKVGFKSIGRVDRHVNRRTGRRNGAFYESILIWRKV